MRKLHDAKIKAICAKKMGTLGNGKYHLGNGQNHLEEGRIQLARTLSDKLERHQIIKINILGTELEKEGEADEMEWPQKKIPTP